jgi:hypothetical protein
VTDMITKDSAINGMYMAVIGLYVVEVGSPKAGKVRAFIIRHQINHKSEASKSNIFPDIVKQSRDESERRLMGCEQDRNPRIAHRIRTYSNRNVTQQRRIETIHLVCKQQQITFRISKDLLPHDDRPSLL